MIIQNKHRIAAWCTTGAQVVHTADESATAREYEMGESEVRIDRFFPSFQPQAQVFEGDKSHDR